MSINRKTEINTALQAAINNIHGFPMDIPVQLNEQGFLSTFTHQGQTIAYLYSYYFDGHIQGLFVHKNYRRNKLHVGRQLLSHYRREVKNKNISSLDIGLVKANKEAIGFFKSNGFETKHISKNGVSQMYCDISR